ncbi:MAG: pirin family protein [Thalassotalea sp.]
MITHIPYQTLGKADHGWLKANHHFSFASYYNAERMNFGTLRVINDDWIAAGKGFAAHPHQNMEIITFVRSGEVSHQDNQGNKGTTKAGEVQVMSAGSGIVHAEYNHSDEPLTLFQIWLETNKQNVQPRWDSKMFPTQFSTHLPLLVSGFAEDEGEALFIYQHARIYGGKIAKGTRFKHSIANQAYILSSSGEFEIADADGKDMTSSILSQGDGAEVTAINALTFTALTDCEILMIDAP